MASEYRPLVSVILPTYNEEHDITGTLDALAAMTYSPLEVVVVDDGSKDRTVEIVEGYSDRIEGLRVLPQKVNRGVSTARNVALKAATGEIAIILNADVRLTADFIERILPHYEDGCDYLLVDSRISNTEYDFPRYLQAQHEYYLNKDRDSAEWTEGYSCKREAALAVGGFPESFPGASGEDAVFGNAMKARYKKATDWSIVVPHVAPPTFSEYWSQRRGRGRGGAYYLHDYEGKPIKPMAVARSFAGTWVLALAILPAAIFTWRLLPYSARGIVDWPPFLFARIIEMMAVAAGYRRGTLEIRAREEGQP